MATELHSQPHAIQQLTLRTRQASDGIDKRVVMTHQRNVRPHLRIE